MTLGGRLDAACLNVNIGGSRSVLVSILQIILSETIEKNRPFYRKEKKQSSLVSFT